jgi:3-methyladenine DNA glycosylase/8-oxoguanine DNA glycosylase
MAHDPAVLRAASRHLRSADPVLGRLIERVGPCRLRVDRGGGPFTSLTEAILYQQITGKAAETIYGRLRVLIGRRHPRSCDIGAVTDEQLRAAGLSRQKISYLRDLCAQHDAGLPLGRLHRMDDERVIETLTAVKGIGRWTAEMYLMFRLGRLDVLPVDDYGVRKAMQQAYRMRKLPKPDRMRKVAEAWRPYRSVGSWYLWRSLDSGALKVD